MKPSVSGIREITGIRHFLQIEKLQTNLIKISQFKVTPYLFPNKLLYIGITNLKQQFESNGFTLNLSEKVSFLTRMFKNV